jgi:hypothetical protein
MLICATGEGAKFFHVSARFAIRSKHSYKNPPRANHPKGFPSPEGYSELDSAVYSVANSSVGNAFCRPRLESSTWNSVYAFMSGSRC